MKAILIIIVIFSLLAAVSCKKTNITSNPPLFDFKLSDLVGKWEGSYFIQVPSGGLTNSIIDLDIQSTNNTLITELHYRKDTGNWNLEGVYIIGHFRLSEDLRSPQNCILKAPFRKDSLIGNIYFETNLFAPIGNFAAGRK